jgi:hypothetical protein
MGPISWTVTLHGKEAPTRNKHSSLLGPFISHKK